MLLCHLDERDGRLSFIPAILSRSNAAQHSDCAAFAANPRLAKLFRGIDANTLAVDLM